MVLPLAFVTVKDLDEYVDDLANELPPELQPFLEWFKDTYLGHPNRHGHGRRPDRTSNYAEAAHRRIQTELVVDHPTIWKLIDGLRKMQKGRDSYYEQLVAGNQPSTKLR
ncbi:hypothetical protein ILUMI_01307 [Ignelater luminosus]|uniref:Uncharacterized protein n=1 Tax=Ignelater luminosus TaxID=2038154 RepID=A0A8K0DEL3_IGNLU|nr:hypothetical protein ILUMI_01307 [Ignelater luminosus]